MEQHLEEDLPRGAVGSLPSSGGPSGSRKDRNEGVEGGECEAAHGNQGVNATGTGQAWELARGVVGYTTGSRGTSVSGEGAGT